MSQPVDIERFEQITDGDKDILRQLSDAYLEQAEEIITSIGAAIESQSMATVRLLSHKLRGSSATCGIVVLVEPLGNLEHLRGEDDFEGAAKLHEEIKNGLEVTRTFLKNHLA